MTTVPASVPVLRWAARRALLHDEGQAVRFCKWLLWLSGEAQPTLKQLDDFAKLTNEVADSSVKRIKIPNECIGGLRFMPP